MAKKSQILRKSLITLVTVLAGYLTFLFLKNKNQLPMTSLQMSRFNQLTDYWLAVAKFETNNFTSRLWRDYFNPWGMNRVSVRDTTQIAGTNDYIVNGEPDEFEGMNKGVYASADSAVQDIVYYMEYFGYQDSYPSLEAFVTEMKNKGYFTAPLSVYLAGVEAYYNA